MSVSPIICQRNGRRIGVSLMSRVTYAGMREATGAISNISFFGFCMRGAVQLNPGDFVSIALPNLGLVRARVAWCESDCFGAAFTKPVDIRKFMLGAGQQIASSAAA